MVDRDAGAAADMRVRARGRRRCLIGAALSLLLASGLHALAGNGAPPAQPPATTAADCSVTGSVRDRTTCYLALPEDRCRAIGAACTSLQDARAQDAALAHAEQDILAKATTRYASYLADDAEYLNDLHERFTASVAAWRTYRDAYCQAEPLVEGMSRQMQEALAQECRQRLTRERTAQLQDLAKAIP